MHDMPAFRIKASVCRELDSGRYRAAISVSRGYDLPVRFSVKGFGNSMGHAICDAKRQWTILLHKLGSFNIDEAFSECGRMYQDR